MHINSNYDSSNKEDGIYESEYIEATQIVEFVPEAQLDAALQQKVKDFLLQSWDNMATEDKADDNGVNLFHEKDFQSVTSKKRKRKKTLSLGNTRQVPSHTKLSL